MISVFASGWCHVAWMYVSPISSSDFGVVCRLSCYRIVFVDLCCRIIDLLHPQQGFVFIAMSQLIFASIKLSEYVFNSFAEFH